MNRIHPLIPDSLRIEKNTHTMTLTWNVICDEPQTLQSIRDMPGVPAYGNICPIATWLKAASVEWKPIDAWNWQATVQYTNNLNATSSSAGVGGTVKPWEEPPVIRYTPGVEMVVEEKYYKADGTQAPILNPAGDPFDNPPQVPRYFTTIEITWNARRFNNNDVKEFKGTINEKPVTIDAQQYPAKLLLLSELTPNPVNDGILMVDITTIDNVDSLRNCIVVRSEDKDNATYQAIVQAYQTAEVAKTLEDSYGGAFIPAWE